VYHQQRLQTIFERWATKQDRGIQKRKSVDLGVSKNAQQIAVEIAMSAAGEIDNILKDYAAGWSRILTLCIDSKVLNQVRNQWDEYPEKSPKCRIDFFLISDLDLILIRPVTGYRIGKSWPITEVFAKVELDISREDQGEIDLVAH
jgi:hypothetical protein